MGWFPSSTSDATAPKASQDGGFIAPDRTARQQCWDGRDSFFKCLDKHGIIDSEREDAKARQLCAPELAEFDRFCANSWVTYFKKRRVMEWKRDQTMKKLSAEGAKPMDMGTGSVTLGSR
ncbi:hypothetical protein K431DRAFT_288757 [Polychaeton citri CBS 116435]|uniref:Cytochrome c oxidase, subunit VIb n=1 Tax=Polychaeton citri CBS 116435 TaxID=1314669 RepID=A0A9P4Q340_9PEZI|nr:hypothetical protein K431DRAFT_288757 [Polychaeton citri CBS 116435]